MQVRNKYFYYGRIPAEYLDEHDGQEGWEPGWYFRFVINTVDEQVNIEDTAGRLVPVEFSALNEMLVTLARVQQELITSIVGAPNQAG